MIKCYFWGYILFDIVVVKGKYKGEVGDNIRELYRYLITKDFMG